MKKPLIHQVILRIIEEFTLEKDPTNVKFVKRAFLIRIAFEFIEENTLEKDHLSVILVIKALFNPETF